MKLLPLLTLLAPLTSAWMLSFYTDVSCTDKVASYADLDVESAKPYPVDEHQDPIRAVTFDDEGDGVSAVIRVYGEDMDGEPLSVVTDCYYFPEPESLEYEIWYSWYFSLLGD